MSKQNSINAPTPITVSNGGLESTSYTAYSVLCSGTTNTGNVQNVSGVGTANYILISNGASALPSWNAGGWIKITKVTANNSVDLQITSGFSTTYKTYMVICEQIVPATLNALLYAQVSADGGLTWLNTSYLSGVNTQPFNSGVWANASATTNFVLSNGISNVGGTTAGLSGQFFFFQLGNNTKPTMCGYGVNTAGRNILACGSYDSTITANAIKFYMSTGNITSGTITIYGLRS